MSRALVRASKVVVGALRPFSPRRPPAGLDGTAGKDITAPMRAGAPRESVDLYRYDELGFEEPTDTGPYELVGRHGSMTAPEVMVPLLVARR